MQRDAVSAEYTEIYCTTCKKSLGRYNKKFYNEDTVVEVLKTTHSVHVKDGHAISIGTKKLDDARPRPHS